MKAKPVKIIDGQGYVECPAAEATHLTINLPGPSGQLTLPVMIGGRREGTPNWTWNGDVEKPTLHPSVLSQSGHYALGFEQGDSCWCTYAKEHPDKTNLFHCYRCHTHINDGMVQFLGDCSHELAGQRLPLLDVAEPEK